MRQSSNHRKGTGRTKQRESKKAWLTRRVKENARLAWLLSADPETITDAEREEQFRRQGEKVWTEQELIDFIN